MQYFLSIVRQFYQLDIIDTLSVRMCINYMLERDRSDRRSFPRRIRPADKVVSGTCVHLIMLAKDVISVPFVVLSIKAYLCHYFT